MSLMCCRVRLKWRVFVLNHIYRLITCSIIFIISVVIFCRNIREVDYSVETVKKAEEASFPILFVKQGDNLIDPMYGYTGNIDAKLVKEGISSVDDTGECVFCIKEYKKDIKKGITFLVIPFLKSIANYFKQAAILSRTFFLSRGLII